MANNSDPEIVSIWFRRMLLADSEIQSIVGQRVFDDVANVRGVSLPFVYWTGDNINVGNNAGFSHRYEWSFDVRGVWDSDLTGASRSPARPLSEALKRVLCDTLVYAAEVPGVGWVHTCRFLRWYRPPARDEGDKRVIEHGITVYLVTS